MRSLLSKVTLAMLMVTSPFAAPIANAQDTINEVAAASARDLAIGKRYANSWSSWWMSNTWMHTDVISAWRQGHMGQGTRITVIDSYNSAPIEGRLTWAWQSQSHGDWVADMTHAVAPRSNVVELSWDSGAAPVALNDRGLNVLNLSYAIFGSQATARYFASKPNNRVGSIVDYAHNGSAVVVKAAGNDSRALDSNQGRAYDSLNVALIGGDSVIFAGALNKNGETSHGCVWVYCWDDRANIANYSNFAGDNPEVQDHYLMVGVERDWTGMGGTSFAAPIISGYAAIVGSKFTTATPTQVARRLLDTARTDTIRDYDVSVHGQGEASLARAIAPSRIR